MAILKHDSDGFLVGEPANLGRMYSTWTAIRKDVKDIKSALLGKKTPKPAQVSAASTRTGKTAESRKVTQPTTRVRTAVTERKTPPAQHTQKPETRKAGGTVSPVTTINPQKEAPAPTAKTTEKRVDKQTAETKPSKVAQPEVLQPKTQQTAETKIATPTRTRRKNAETATPGRDSKGRFVAKDGDSSVERAEESRRAGEFAEKVGEAVKDAGKTLKRSIRRLRPYRKLPLRLSAVIQCFSAVRETMRALRSSNALCAYSSAHTALKTPKRKRRINLSKRYSNIKRTMKERVAEKEAAFYPA